ncbi:hypothetical protein [Streptomyces cinereoruber]|uniref:hypothetical protein n=1 Tax=Streptomyces cinereoruber TaxID=67260 RepID=UPI00363E221C
MPSKKSSDFVNDLRAASARLAEVGSPEHAATVDKLLVPGGWELLRTAELAGTNNIPIHMPLVLRAAIQKAAQNSDSKIRDDVAEGLEAFIAGTFSPASNAYRARRNTGLETGNLNVRVDGRLKDRFQDAVEARAAELGHKPALSLVAKAWLIEKYQLPFEDITRA